MTNSTLVDTAVEVREATRIFQGQNAAVTALDSVSLAIPAGRFTAVVGPSGSGKSTLLHCAAGLEPLTIGSIRIGDVELSGLSETQRTMLRRDRIGFVFQAYNLVSSLSVSHNITLPARLAAKPVDHARLNMLLDRVGIADQLHRMPAELSGGQQQRVAIVRALAMQPDVVFADEPTGALDLRTAAEVLDLLRDLVDVLGQTVVMVTHDPVAAARAHQAVIMANGRISSVVTEPSAPEVAHLLLEQEA